jgi:5-methylcytosine-specific restriction endonuclease McrA
MPSGIYKRTQGQLNRLKLRGFQKGQVFTDAHIMNLKNKTFSKTHRKNLSISLSGKRYPERSGNKSNFWKDGRCNDKQYVSWLKNKRNRIIKSKTIGSHTYGEWQILKAQYNWTCLCCKKSEPKIKLTEDHIIPVSKGGSDNIENIQPLCLKCNIKKHTKIINYKDCETQTAIKKITQTKSKTKKSAD